MRELRSIVNAVCLFAVFLMLYAVFTPGHARSSANRPRFLRMEVDDLRHPNSRQRVTVTVPYFFIGNALRFAALGRMHRELDVHWNEEIDAAELQKLWEDLKAAPEGEEVIREHDEQVVKLKRQGETIVLDYAYESGRGENVTVRFPARLMEAAVTDGRDFDVDALIAELRAAKVGDLVEVSSEDAHVKVWLE
jgi:hypothetical protein